MTHPPVNTKKDFVCRFIRGEFGNKGPNWNTFDELQMDDIYGFKGSWKSQLYHIRNRRPQSTTYYNLTLLDADEKWNELRKIEDMGLWYLASMAPHEKNLLQGEVRLSHSGLDLYCSNAVDLPMRDALAKDGKTYTGLTAILLLKRTLCSTSYDWLQVLLDRYPSHVVEFSTFSTNWGTIPSMNTVFWEVRNY